MYWSDILRDRPGFGFFASRTVFENTPLSSMFSATEDTALSPNLFSNWFAVSTAYLSFGVPTTI